MQECKIHVGNGKVDPGWTRAIDFHDFKSLLKALSLQKISAIKFDKELDQDEYDSQTFNPEDCAHYLIEVAKGKPLPICFTVGENRAVSEVIDHYVRSYKHENYCGKILT